MGAWRPFSRMESWSSRVRRVSLGIDQAIRRRSFNGGELPSPACFLLACFLPAICQPCALFQIFVNSVLSFLQDRALLCGMSVVAIIYSSSLYINGFEPCASRLRGEACVVAACRAAV